MKKNVLLLLFAYVLFSTSTTRADTISRTLIYDTIRYGHECYAFNDPGGVMTVIDPWGYVHFSYMPSLGHYYDTVYAIQQYANCREVYGVAMMFDFYERYLQLSRIGSCRTSRYALKYIGIYAVLHVSHEDGTMEKIDEVRWDTLTPYKFFQFYPPLTYADQASPICELYFSNPHIIPPTDTAWVGFEIRLDKAIDTIAEEDEFNLLFIIYTLGHNRDGKWKSHCSYACDDCIPENVRRWGGVFPITCPKPEEPVEDTVDNGIRDVSYLNSNISIYPNPATDFITINCDNMQKAVIYNSLGQQALSFTTNKADISTLPNGIYTIRIETSKGSIIKKIVKR